MNIFVSVEHPSGSTETYIPQLQQPRDDTFNEGDITTELPIDLKVKI